MTSLNCSRTNLLGRILPDELPWAYYGRLHERYPAFDFKSVLGATPSYRKAFPTQLERLARAFAYTGTPTAAEMINDNTFYRFALTEISRRASEHLARSMAEQTFPSFAPRHLIHDTDFQLRLCPHCIQDDVAKFGTAYFHRLHQLAELRICTIHGTALHATTVRAGQRKFVPALEAALQMSELVVRNSALQQTLAHAYQTIAGRSSGVFGEQVRSALKGLLIEHGLFTYNQVGPALVEKMTSKFGGNVVCEFRLAEKSTRLSSWQSVPKLALICATLAIPFEELMNRAALVIVGERHSKAVDGEKDLLFRVQSCAPAAVAKLKRETNSRVSPWALANGLKESLGPGFAANYSWKPSVRAVLMAHAESRQQFRERLARAA